MSIEQPGLVCTRANQPQNQQLSYFCHKNAGKQSANFLKTVMMEECNFGHEIAAAIQGSELQGSY
jgi:hypothetical protein